VPAGGPSSFPVVLAAPPAWRFAFLVADDDESERNDGKVGEEHEVLRSQKTKCFYRRRASILGSVRFRAYQRLSHQISCFGDIGALRLSAFGQQAGRESSMSIYLIANIRVNDSERYKDYVANVPALIEKHGGEYRVRGGETQVLEGQWIPDRLVVLEFPDRDAAMAFYNDPDYAPFRELRQAVTDSALVLVDGCD
jgi:uncharacterized protein (DUF1330 family)